MDLLYPKIATVKSKKMLAAVNPKKWYGFATSAKLMRVAIAPIMVMAPIFLIHHAASISTEKPTISQKNGRWDMLKKMGAKMEFNTPHKAAHIDIAAISRVLKYVMPIDSSNTIFKNSNTTNYLTFTVVAMNITHTKAILMKKSLFFAQNLRDVGALRVRSKDISCKE